MLDLKKYKYLFLDRDGVINRERPNDYVKNRSEFVFIENTLEAISILSKYFDHIVIVTNQRGVGRGTMTEADLNDIHAYMLGEIEKSGGRIDKIYSCIDTDYSSPNRKPNSGMAYQAQADFPSINFQESIMVGNSKSDIQFSNKLEMYSVLVGDKYRKGNEIYQIVDIYCENLYKFASIFTENSRIICKS